MSSKSNGKSKTFPGKVGSSAKSKDASFPTPLEGGGAGNAVKGQDERQKPAPLTAFPAPCPRTSFLRLTRAVVVIDRMTQRRHLQSNCTTSERLAGSRFRKKCGKTSVPSYVVARCTWSVQPGERALPLLRLFQAHARSHRGRAGGGAELPGGGGALRHGNRRAGRRGFQPAAISGQPPLSGISLAHQLREPGGGPRFRDRARPQRRLRPRRPGHRGAGFSRPDHGAGDQLIDNSRQIGLSKRLRSPG